jgi:tungstate transport system ATP-binding protein
MTTAYELNNIKVLHNNVCILNIAKLRITSGKCIALLGENGAGKSTLMNLLAFTAKANQGTIKLFEQVIVNNLKPKQRRRIAMVSQQPYLLSGTVRDNINLALKLQGIDRAQHASLIEKTLQQLNLSHLAEQAAQTLSGGELKRVAIARAIVYDPDILLLDEPFSHLDQRHVKQLEAAIQSFANKPNKTVIFSTHDHPQGLAIADETLNLHAGKITAAPLLNLFHGSLKQHDFDTGKLVIHVNSDLSNANHIAIDPHEIIISHQALDSSMRNCFKGRVILIAQETNTIRLTIDCGEAFQAIISPESLKHLDLAIADTVWLSFKSTAVTVF